MATIFETLTLADTVTHESSHGGHAARAPAAALSERYEPFLSIDIRHGFFNGQAGVTDEITVKPSARTLERLRLFGFLPHRRRGGLDLLWTAETLARANRSVAAMRRRGGDPGIARLRAQLSQPLLFTVAVNNPRFGAFTEMPTNFRIGDPPLLLSNQRSTPGADRQATLTVDWARRVGVASIVASGGMEGASGGASAPASSQMIGPVHPLLAEEAALARSQPFAVLELYFTAASVSDEWDGMPVDLCADIGDEACFKPVHYLLSFAPRQTCWRYFVAARSGAVEPDGLKVVTLTGEDAGFVRDTAPHPLPDGRPAWCLVSRDPRPLFARSVAALSLVGSTANARGRVRTLVERLPAPGPDSLVPRQAASGGDPPPAWSDIYVFV
jgi:hypothetical protein